jgi:EAL domain-containing protein (putative c-di-GMP-specific phosphodiesterase class I)
MHIDHVIEEYLKLFDIFCESYLEELPPNVRKKQGIIDVKSFCREKREVFKDLIYSFFNDKKKFEKLTINMGRQLYKNDLSIAFVIDITNTLFFKVINYMNTEHLPNYLIDYVNQFMQKFTNLVALGFILESLPEKEKKLKSKISSESAQNLCTHFSKLKSILLKGDYQFEELANCPITHYMQSLEFRILCPKLDICKEANRIHSLIHTYLKLFKTYFKEEKYLPAYLILITLYFLFEKLGEIFNNIESAKKNISLEEVISFILDEKKEIILFVVDPREISFLNKIFGYTVGDNIFYSLIKKLTATIPNDKRQAVIKCSYGAVCVISDNTEMDYEEIFLKLKKLIKEEFKSLPIKVDISGFLLRIPENINLSKKSLLNTIRFAMRKSKKNPSTLFILDLRKLDNYKKIVIFKTLYEDLVEKLSSGNLGLAIQGIYNLKTRSVNHYEVLVRLRDNKGEIIPAYEFIDVVYEYRLIDLLDVMVLRKIVENANLFKDKFIFVNISPRTFKVSPSFEEVKKLTEQMKEKGLKFGFEITEQATIEDFDVIVNFFNKMKIPISIDDFGTGYSSFSHFVEIIERVPVELLKIDGSYVKKIPESGKAEKIVKTVNSMAHSLNIKTVAEFAENEKIVEKLEKIGVDYAQGYYFEKPKILV